MDNEDKRIDTPPKETQMEKEERRAKSEKKEGKEAQPEGDIEPAGDNLNTADKANELVKELLALKRKLIEDMKLPEKEKKAEEKKPAKKKKKKKRMMDNIMDDGGFVISDDEKEDDEEEDAKSVSTNASLKNVLVEFFYEKEYFEQRVFSSSKTKIYCEKVCQMLGEFAKDVKGEGLFNSNEDQEASSREFKVGEDLLAFLYNFLVINMVEQAEIEIFFFFFSDLVEPVKNKIYLTESAFAKLFYEILLHLKPSLYTAKIYAALENCILFINSHLKLIKTDSFGNIKVIEQKRIIGFEAILDVHIHTEDDRVKMKTRKIFQSVISKQIENIDMIETIVIDEFLAPLLSKIEDLKEKIPIEPQESIKALKVVLKLIEETQQFMIEKLRRYDMMSSIQINTIGNQETDENGIKVIKLNEMDGTDTTPSGPQLLKGFYEEIMIKVNNTTFKKPPSTFKVNLYKSDTLLDLKHRIVEVLDCFTPDHIYIMAWGRALYNNERTIWELGLNEGNTVMVVVKEEDPTMDIELDLMTRHKTKIEQVKGMMPDYDNEFVSYVLAKKKEDVNDVIMTFTSESDKDRYFKEFSELKMKKMNAENKLYGPSDGKDGSSKPGKGVETLRKVISNHKDLYDTLVNLMEIKNKELSNRIWAILRNLPASQTLKRDIISEFFEESYGGFGFEDSKIMSQLMSNPVSNISYYYFEILGRVLMKIIKDKETAKLTEFFMNESALKLINILLYNCDSAFETFYSIVRKEELTTKTRQETEDLEQIYYLVPIFGVIHNIFDIAIDSQVINQKSAKIEISNQRLSYLSFKTELEKAVYEDSDKINMEMISDIAKSIIMNEAVFNKLMEFYLIIIRAIWLNSYNFAGNGNVIGITFNLFGLLDKRSMILEQQGDQSEEKFIYFDKLLEFFLEISTLKSNCVLGNLLMNHLNCFRGRIPVVYERVMKIVISRGYFTHVPSNVYIVTKILGEFKATQDQNSLKSALNNVEKGQEMLQGYFDLLEKLPKFDEIIEENFDKLMPNNFEGILEIMNMLVVSINGLNCEVPKDKIDALYTKIVSQNLKKLFSEEQSIFYNCLSKGQTNLKNKFLSICLNFCKIRDEYCLEIIQFLSTVYTKKDFQMKSFHSVDIRKGQEYIGLKNLGCTCYANSLIQQFFHNPTIKKGIMSTKVDKEDINQIVLYQVKNVFWNLEYSKMAYTFLDGFCSVFTGFDGMPINVRIQQDVNEFFNLLVDMLERQIIANNKDKEANEQVDVFKEEFGGQFVNIIQSMEEEYEYLRERPENFLTVPLTVKNMVNVSEALDEFCSEEYFKDDNKLHIDQYDKKIAVSKKYMFKKLPKTMIFNLKRFEYNMQTFQRYKLNDFFEFPMDIDLRKWCKFDNKEEEKQETKYVLKGVLIHSGSAQAGHYYSYIKKGEEWLEFNDTNVREFNADLQNLHKEWFGAGKTEADDTNFVSMNMGGCTCAYMLFYQRVDCLGGEDDLPEQTEDWKLQMAEIEAENKTFIRQKIYVDSISLKFLEKLLNCMDKPTIVDKLCDMLFEKVAIEEKAEAIEDETVEQETVEEAAEGGEEQGDQLPAKSGVEAAEEQDPVQEPEAEKYEIKVLNESLFDILVQRNAPFLQKFVQKYPELRKKIPNDNLFNFQEDQLDLADLHQIAHIFGDDDLDNNGANGSTEAIGAVSKNSSLDGSMVFGMDDADIQFNDVKIDPSAFDINVLDSNEDGKEVDKDVTNQGNMFGFDSFDKGKGKDVFLD